MSKKALIFIFLAGILGIASSLLYLLKGNGAELEQRSSGGVEQIVDVSTGSAWLSGMMQEWQEVEGEVKTGSITIMMPGFLYGEDLRVLGEGLKDQDITVHFQLIDDLVEYKHMLIGQLTTGITVDLLLLPVDWLAGVTGDLAPIEVWEILAPYFHPVFAEYVDLPEFGFVPYSLDPLVSFIDQELALEVQYFDLSALVSYLHLYEEQKKMALPLLWGVGKNDLRLLYAGGESFEHYFAVLYHLLDQVGSVAELDALLELSTLDLGYTWDFFDFKQLYTTIGKRNTFCEVYPSLCLFVYDFSDMRFGFISDQAIWQAYFDQAPRSMSSVSLFHFPGVEQSYPVRGWGFVLPRSSEKSFLVEQFLTAYVKAGIANELDLWQDQLSPFTNILSFQKTQKKYTDIFLYEPYFNLWYAEMDLQAQFLADGLVEGLFKHSVESIDYLSGRQELGTRY